MDINQYIQENKMRSQLGSDEKQATSQTRRLRHVDIQATSQAVRAQIVSRPRFH